MSFYPAPVGGGGSIGGSITAGQVAIGETTANTIGGSSALTWVSSVLLVNGSQKIKRTATAIDYAVQLTDFLIAITDDSVGRTMTLPTVASAGNGRMYIFVDEGGAAGTNNITLAAAMGETIDNVPLIQIKIDYGTAALYCNGAAWFALYIL